MHQKKLNTIIDGDSNDKIINDDNDKIINGDSNNKIVDKIIDDNDNNEK